MGRTDKEIYRVIDNVNSYYRINSESKKELLLNKYPNAAAAYSLRLLDGYYRGPLVRVRRDGGVDDGVEVDVYPDYNNQLSLDSLVTNVDVHTTNDGIPDADATFLKSLQSLGEFVSNPNYVDGGTAVDATVCVWYDQSSTDGVPNDNDASQNVATSQPLIVSGGVIVTENGKPAVEFDGAGDRMTSAATAASDFTTSVVLKALTASQTNQWLLQDTSGSDMLLRHKITLFDFYDGTTHDIGTAGTDQHHIFITANSSGSVVSFDGADQSLGSIGNNGYTDLEIGGDSGSRWWHGRFNEIVIWDSYQATNRTGIEEDINSFYQIDGYTPTPKLIDLTQDLAVENGGTIADGTPAAAYSLRLLSSTYNGPLVRIRRTIDNTEVDVYPDSDGEFSIYSTIEDGGTELTTGVTGGSTDKTTLHEFLYGQDTDCTVVRWYDQAGANDATQTTAGNQPKIYDSISGVVTDANGDATLDGDATTLTYMSLTSNVVMNTDWSVFMAGDFLNGDRTAGSGSYMFLVNTQTSSTSARSDISSGITTSWPLGSTGSKVWSLNMDSSTGNFNLRVNSVDSNQTANTANYTITDLFYYGNVSLWTKGSIKEVILYQSSQYDNRTNIEQNINQHYNIY